MEVLNNDGVTYLAAAFFTGFFGLLSIVAKGIFDVRREARDQSSVIESRLNEIERTLSQHMSWHVNQRRK